MRKFIYIILFVCLAVGFSSCQEKEIYYHFEEIKDAKWSKYDTLVFDIDSTLFELNKPYNITIEVTNNINYPYQNIWFFVQTDFGYNSIFSEISKEYLLADEFGRWKGSGFGSLYQTSLSFDKQVTFDTKRNYQIRVQQGMRDEPLVGIEKVGIKIEKAF